MKNIFQPDLYINSLDDLDLKRLKEEGYRNILIDLDNTLAPYYDKHIDERAKEILDKMSEEGLFVVVMSNNHEERVRDFLKGTDHHYQSMSLKPTKVGYKKILERYGLKASETLAIGDQILTDIVGANRMKIFSILVEPLVEKDSFSTRINRQFEKILYKIGAVKK